MVSTTFRGNRLVKNEFLNTHFPSEILFWLIEERGRMLR